MKHLVSITGFALCWTTSVFAGHNHEQSRHSALLGAILNKMRCSTAAAFKYSCNCLYICMHVFLYSYLYSSFKCYFSAAHNNSAVVMIRNVGQVRKSCVR